MHHPPVLMPVHPPTSDGARPARKRQRPVAGSGSCRACGWRPRARRQWLSIVVLARPARLFARTGCRNTGGLAAACPVAYTGAGRCTSYRTGVGGQVSRHACVARLERDISRSSTGRSGFAISPLRSRHTRSTSRLLSGQRQRQLWPLSRRGSPRERPDPKPLCAAGLRRSVRWPGLRVRRKQCAGPGGSPDLIRSFATSSRSSHPSACLARSPLSSPLPRHAHVACRTTPFDAAFLEVDTAADHLTAALRLSSAAWTEFSL
jgi:hypothetical protein